MVGILLSINRSLLGWEMYFLFGGGRYRTIWHVSTTMRTFSVLVNIIVGEGVIEDMIEAFANTEFEGDRHAKGVAKIEEGMCSFGADLV